MKYTNIALLLLIPGTLASCSMTTDSAARYGQSSQMQSSYAVIGDHPTAKPQASGWFTSPQIRQAEKKSLSQDMPFAVVNPNGTVQ